MLDKFNAGLHYPTNVVKDNFAEMFGVSSDSVSQPSPLCNLNTNARYLDGLNVHGRRKVFKEHGRLLSKQHPRKCLNISPSNQETIVNQPLMCFLRMAHSHQHTRTTR